MNSASFRVGILTGGGDCPGLNAVIRAVAKSLMLQHDAEIIGIRDGFQGLIERHVEPLEYVDVSGILTRGGTILGASNKANPFSYYRRGNADVSAEALKTYQGLGLDGLVTIGGDGTMSIAHRLAEMGMNIVGVPKTIDNDLVGTDETFGFDTAVSIATDAMDRIHTTAQSHHRVMVVETMGRYAGWIALHAGTASGADIILIPEIDYDVEEVARVCQTREDSGQRFTIIAIAEGATPVGGEMAVRERIEDSPDPLRLGGIGNMLAHDLKDRVTSAVRTTILGHVQRGGSPTAYDRNLSTTFGAMAAKMMADGQFGRMVAYQNGGFTSVPLSDVADKTRTVGLDNPLLRSALAVGTSFGQKDLSNIKS
ncbi:6-phosphofructokinase [Longibacter salinarum]|uniref:ATP-dependent 6-phosphofructokinase n=1 Tax=Longibacter salinarum TaxID=1850348 RepID=A0A2A8CZP3_9BACT|nr:ATP-dependent 6-phosphofructokinase [Longibacter salinarum]PEN14081.1 6-phosphofructokinase [Longibacter salinarum]